MAFNQHILATAVVGTERQQLTIPSDIGDLGPVLSAIDLSDREGALLKSSAFVSLYQLAGLVPETDTGTLIEPSENEDQAILESESGLHLSLMLGGQFKEVLPEWLAAVRNARKCVPAEFLPALLDKGHSDQPLRPLVLEVIGKRGRWIARQNDRWKWAMAVDNDDGWETESHDVRLSMLRRLRKTEPSRAVQLVSSSWKSENAKDRQAFLGAFIDGLNAADEAFLSEAIQDRSAEVRRTAFDLLVRLPTSDLSRKVSERVSSLLTYKKPLLGKGRFDINLPDDLMAETRIESEAQLSSDKAKTLGEKAVWLLHAIGAVDPSKWCSQWNRKANELLQAAHNSDWKDSLLPGFVIAASRFADQDWMEALLIDRQIRLAGDQSMKTRFHEILRRLQPGRLEALLLKEYSDGIRGLRLDPDVLSILQQHRSEWSEEFSRAIVSGIKVGIKTLQKTDPSYWQLRTSLKLFALCVSPSLSDELTSDWPDDSENTWVKVIEEFQWYLRFRRDMLRAIV